MSKYVFITGGTKGIGKAVAECLAKSGYHLILTYSADQKTAVNTQQELQAKYGISVSIDFNEASYSLFNSPMFFYL